VFDTLIESKRKSNSKRLFGVGFMSLTIHTVIIAAAVYATLNAGQTDNSVKVDTTVVYLQQQQQKPPEQQPVQLDVPLKGFQTVVAPDVVPTNLPPVNLQEHFDPKDYSGTGVEGGLGTGIVPTGNDVYMEAIVEEKPSVPVYPELLKQAQIQGRVIVQAVIDTLGRAEPNTIKILQSPNPGFDQPSRNYVLKTLFRPARVHGRAVRVLINIPIDYKITQGR